MYYGNELLNKDPLGMWNVVLSDGAWHKRVYEGNGLKLSCLNQGAGNCNKMIKCCNDRAVKGLYSKVLKLFTTLY